MWMMARVAVCMVVMPLGFSPPVGRWPDRIKEESIQRISSLEARELAAAFLHRCLAGVLIPLWISTCCSSLFFGCLKFPLLIIRLFLPHARQSSLMKGFNTTYGTLMSRSTRYPLPVLSDFRYTGSSFITKDQGEFLLDAYHHLECQLPHGGGSTAGPGAWVA